MEYRGLGRSGLKVSPLCLGTMMFGGATDDATATRIVARARDQGVNFIDSADGYAGGKSEEVVGRAIREHRSWWVLATKCANPTGPRGSQDPNAQGLSRRHVQHAVEASLRRLGVQEIDVLYLHKEDHATPLAETVHVLADLIRVGKIRYFGVSNYRGWRVVEICRLCDEAGIDRPVASQPLYNALNREVEVEHLPACGYFGLGVVPYSPLAARRADREIRSGRAAAARDQGRPAGPADAGIGVAFRKPTHRARDSRTRSGQGHVARAVRDGLGAEQPVCHGGDRWPKDRGAVGGLCWRVVMPAGRGGRGAGRSAGLAGASVHAGL
jgi:aryl-alcohol dehydrogenase-like predicted oxidoreductase